LPPYALSRALPLVASKYDILKMPARNMSGDFSQQSQPYAEIKNV
jgi:hypothetical protein